MNRRHALQNGLVAATTVGLLAITGCDTSTPIPSDFTRTGLKPGLQAPIIAGPDLDGQQMSLADFKGNVVLLEFWSPS